ncbi:MAG: hypothetical protein KJ914_17515 [Gammaproteobacteria bacterium]|nr:hypothetical protein [Gammaproteobacteria bacterium]MBU1724328.1 hypothetical protein [Gammaproteobacteria bacterium]MBU2006244.1 hypothetical protein [Gammaproteobacteria bacterium]
MLNLQDVYNRKRVLVITGTTGFDSLIQAIDENRELENAYDIVLQIGEGTYKPKHKTYFEFDNQLKQKISEYDFFITHAGAGTIFMLLEYGKRVLVVPNTDRADKHQIELAQYVGSSHLCAVCPDVASIAEHIENINFTTSGLHSYEKKEFSAAREILNYIYES